MKESTNITSDYYTPTNRTCSFNKHALSRFSLILELLALQTQKNRGYICGRGLPLDQDSPSGSYVTYYWPLASLSERPVDLTQYRTVTLFESRRLIESGTTGLRTWQASFVLAQHLTRYPSKPYTRHVCSPSKIDVAKT